MPDQPRDRSSASAENSVLRRRFGLWIWSLLLIAETVVLARRFSGEFEFVIPLNLAVVSTLAVATISWLGWALQSVGDGRSADRSFPKLIPIGIPVGITAIWALAISANANSTTVGLLSGIVLINFSLAAWIGVGGDASLAFILPNPLQVKNVNAVEHSAISPTSTPAPAGSVQTEAEVDPDCLDDQIESDPDTDFEDQVDDVSQSLWLSRRDVGDCEIVEGWVRVHFSAGQRETQVHIAFCPPLAGSPEIETEDLDGLGLEIRVAALFSFGARLSIRRSDPLQDVAAHRVGFAAQSATISRAA